MKKEKKQTCSVQNSLKSRCCNSLSLACPVFLRSSVTARQGTQPLGVSVSISATYKVRAACGVACMRVA
ncbi:hypothetical protein E2C01_054174 [Portunus trituberculatus]|uniref:Uncharacterized protein n=1 Tax=Portunus trituberculatus TaxID=210409 RepID=A0A5B7GSH0_PORTR|nr:hypothetical protein [Portunus trituberculatus]